MAKTYSGGMRRRLDLAASLVGRPAVVFLDEPTTGLDPAKREDMWDVVRGLVGEGSTVLLTTQYLEEADALADEIGVIDHGRVIAHDTADGLKRIVGGQTDRRPTDRPGPAGRRRPILAEITGNPQRSPAATSASVPVPDEAAVRALVGAGSRRPASASIELSLHLPSLDEVFFNLTGDGTATDTGKEERGMTATIQISRRGGRCRGRPSARPRPGEAPRLTSCATCAPWRSGA